MLVPGHELYLQPFGAMTDAELLGAVQHNGKFAPCKRLYQQVIRRGIWELALAYPLLLEHARYFLDVVKRAPYHNQTELNRQCERIVADGVADLISAKLAEAEDAKLRFDMSCSIFRRLPDIHVPSTIWIFPRKRRRA
jgi:hypothetical protein